MRKIWTQSSFGVVVLIFVWTSLTNGEGISCYVCSSVNGSDTPCEDPIQPDRIQIVRECKQGKQGHQGLFWAQYCFKIKGTRLSDNRKLIVRRCSLLKLTETTNHCGQFRLDNELYTGCIASCQQDGCNDSTSVYHWTSGLGLLSVASLGHILFYQT